MKRTVLGLILALTAWSLVLPATALANEIPSNLRYWVDAFYGHEEGVQGRLRVANVYVEDPDLGGHVSHKVGSVALWYNNDNWVEVGWRKNRYSGDPGDVDYWYFTGWTFSGNKYESWLDLEDPDTYHTYNVKSSGTTSWVFGRDGQTIPAPSGSGPTFRTGRVLSQAEVNYTASNNWERFDALKYYDRTANLWSLWSAQGLWKDTDNIINQGDTGGVGYRYDWDKVTQSEWYSRI